jgi:hypothetical protein
VAVNTMDASNDDTARCLVSALIAGHRLERNLSTYRPRGGWGPERLRKVGPMKRRKSLVPCAFRVWLFPSYGDRKRGSHQILDTSRTLKPRRRIGVDRGVGKCQFRV